jgi:dynein heavy chain
MNKDFT